MSTDKLQPLHEDLAGIFTESALISTHTEPSQPAFDHEALSGIFSEPHQVSIDTGPSHPASDHEALSEIFGESHQISTYEEPPHLASDRKALSEIFSEPHLISTNTELSSPIFDNAALAKLFSEALPVSTNTNPSQPSFNHQTLAELLSEPRPVPIDPQPSPLSFDTGSSSEPLSGHPDNEEPVAKAVAAASSTNVEGAPTQRARSLLTKLHHIFSTKAEPPPSDIEKDPSPPSLSGQPRSPEPATKAVAAASPAEAENARPQRPRPLLTELRPLTLASTEPPPVVEKTPGLSGRVGNVEPAAKTAAPPIDAESARVWQPRSLLVEPVSPTSTNIEPSPPTFGKEPSRPVLFDRLANVEPAKKTNQPGNPEPAANAAPTDAESAGARREKPSLRESRLISITGETPPLIPEKHTSRPTLSGQPDNVKPAAEIVAVASPANTESARPQHATSLPAERPAPISIDTKSSPADFQRQPSPPTRSGQLDKLGPSVSTVAVLPAKPPLPIFEKDRPEPASNIVGAESAVMQSLEEKPQLSEVTSLDSTILKSPPRTFENEPSLISFSAQPDHAEAAARFAAAPSLVETESALAPAQQAKSLLATLDLGTAIRLRWVLRDIRSKRTKLSPVSASDLTALMDLGLVEMREELPRLTALGVLALD